MPDQSDRHHRQVERRRRHWWHRALVHPGTQYLLPTLSTLYYNRWELKGPAPLRLPDTVWSRRERREALVRSEERLRGIEAKGPGLAAASAIVGAAVLVAMTEGWDKSNVVGKLLLALAVVYSIFSLFMPIYLVGQQQRHGLDGVLVDAAAQSQPESWLAERAAECAAANTARTMWLGNLQDAARNDLAVALSLLAVWLVLVPLTGIFG